MGQFDILKKFDFEYPPVGVKFCARPPRDLPRIEPGRDFCELVADAQQGAAFYAGQEEIGCIGPLLLGMLKDDPIFESGKVGPKLGAYRTDTANRHIYDYLPRIKDDSVRYVAYAPLDKLTFRPDLLIIMSSVSQAEILNRARTYSSGEMWEAKGTPVAGCAWLYLHPYLTGEINFTVTGFGFGMKARRIFPEGRVLMTIPRERIPEMMKNLRDMPWEPVSFRLGREGHKEEMRQIAAEIGRELKP
jgi:uncharacterized protein (DUF169 family)